MASWDTFAGQVTELVHVGWVVDYDAAEISRLFSKLSANRDLLERPHQAARRFAALNTWEVRAQAAADVLLACSGS